MTDEIKHRIKLPALKADPERPVDVVITEIGGTVGDIESLPFLEAVRQLRVELGPQNSVSVHVTLIPHIAAAGELKTKPTQHSVKELLGLGIQPEILLCDEPTGALDLKTGIVVLEVNDREVLAIGDAKKALRPGINKLYVYSRGRTGFEDNDYPQAEIFRQGLAAANSIDAAALAAQGLRGPEIAEALKQQRIAAIHTQISKPAT